MEYSNAANSVVAKRAQNGLSVRCVPGTDDATVWKGHIEMSEYVSASVIFAPGAQRLRRAVIFGANTASQVFVWASELPAPAHMLLSRVSFPC
jgi:hypothetical protein